MTQKQTIKNFLLKHSHLEKKELYDLTQKKFGVNRKRISEYWCELFSDKAEKQIKFREELNNAPTKTVTSTGSTYQVDIDNLEQEVKTLEDLLFVCEVDINKWDIISWQCKKWDLGIKNADSQIETKCLYSVSAKFAPKKIEKDLSLQKDIILKELFDNSPYVDAYPYKINKHKKDKVLLELALFDVHFGKLAHREECGEDYDLKIAVDRYNTAIQDILSKVSSVSIDKILLPIGNDMINIDNLQGTTTAGTPQDTDSRFHKIVRTVKNLLINTIEKLLHIAPVDVVVVSGNHDEQTSFMIGEMLDAYFYNNENVNVNNGVSPRKYYQWGNTSIMFTHGNREKHGDLGMIFAAENPKLWADTKQRFIQLGHFHKVKKVNYINSDEYQGFQIQIIPSLSGSDAWHKGKGYMSLKQAKGFLFSAEEGLISEITHNAKK